MKAAPILILAAGAVILVVTGVLFGIPEVRRAAQIGAAGKARIQLERWALAAEAYQQVHGALPDVADAALLEALHRDGASSNVLFNASGLGREADLVDPWGTPWRIRGGERVEVLSAGPNRQFGDEDDISSQSFQRPPH
jgi:hypothetical protein